MLGPDLLRAGFPVAYFQGAMLGQAHPCWLGTEAHSACSKSALTDAGGRDRALLPCSDLEGQKIRGQSSNNEEVKRNEALQPCLSCPHVLIPTQSKRDRL